MKPSVENSPARALGKELRGLRRDLRGTVRAYLARLEIALAESAVSVAETAAAGEVSKERLHEIRDLTAFVRKRKVKPEKGRRKDLRKLDDIIHELHATIHPEGPR